MNSTSRILTVELLMPRAQTRRPKAEMHKAEGEVLAFGDCVLLDPCMVPGTLIPSRSWAFSPWDVLRSAIICLQQAAHNKTHEQKCVGINS